MSGEVVTDGLNRAKQVLYRNATRGNGLIKPFLKMNGKIILVPGSLEMKYCKAEDYFRIAVSEMR